MIKATRPVVEFLEERRLLSTTIYTVPSGHTTVYLEKVFGARGNVDVFLDAHVGQAIFTFTGANDLDEIYSAMKGLTVIDEVPAASKPFAANNQIDPYGVCAQLGSGGTLKIIMGIADTTMEETANALNSTTFTATDTGGYTGIDMFGPGVDSVSVITSASATHVIVPNLLQALTVDTRAGTGNITDLGGAGSGVDEGADQRVSVLTGTGNDSVNVRNDHDGDNVAPMYGTANITFGAGSGNALTVTGFGAVATLTNSPSIASVNLIGGGAVHLDQSGKGNTTTFGTLTLATDAVGGLGIVDVGAQRLKINSINAATLRGYINAGYRDLNNGQNWQGAGITSGYGMALPANYAVGYAVPSDNISSLGLTGNQAMVVATV